VDLIQSLRKLCSFNDLNTLGVVNLTPNSFSDGNKYTETHFLNSTLQQFINTPNLVIDLGFESTAPMNSAITLLEERKRFDHFYEEVKDIDFSGKWISFDTYKLENYQYFENKFKARWENLGFILNDVSGVIDDEYLNFLKGKKNQEDFFAIYSHTHIPERDLTLKHMDYLIDDDILTNVRDHFVKAEKVFKAHGLERQILFDPCFGFSKSYEQNWDLLSGFAQLVDQLSEVGIVKPWLIGISKKSFLRKSLTHSLDPYGDSENLHENILQELMIKNLGHLLFRVHDPKIVERASLAARASLKKLQTNS
jgi:dihydropteroate synthase